MANKKKSKTASTVTITMPKADSDKLLQQGYDLIQTGKAQDLQKAEECFEQSYAQGNADALTGLLVLANVYNSKEKLTLGGKELCWDTDVKDNQKAYEILIKIKEALHGEDVLPGGLRLSDEFIHLCCVLERDCLDRKFKDKYRRLAQKCCMQAMELGCDRAPMYYVDLLFAFDSKNFHRKEAYDILFRSVDSGNTQSMIELARVYRYGGFLSWRTRILYEFRSIFNTVGFFFICPILMLIVPFFIKLWYVAVILHREDLVNPILSYIKCTICGTSYNVSLATVAASKVAQTPMPFESAVFFLIPLFIAVLFLVIFIRSNLDISGYLHKQGGRYKDCYNWIQRAAKAHDPTGIEHQAYCLFYGIGVKKNRTKAICLFEQAAKQNNFNALVFLGRAYEKGKGVPTDLIKAKNYYEKARSQNLFYYANEGQACYWLGSAYKKGTCVLQDKEYAEQCFHAADRTYLCCLYGIPFQKNIPMYFLLWMRKGTQAKADLHKAEFEVSQHKINTLTTENGQLAVKVDTLAKENTQLRNALALYQESISKAYAAWSNTDTSSQNDADYFALCEKISQKAAESQETEYEKAKKALKERFGEYWNRLQPDSQIGLISARTLYELSIQQNATTFDFSGVCISATSALELELKKIFLTDYVKFAKKESLIPDTWPEALRYWSSDSQKWKAKDRFTLGDLPYILESTQTRGSALLNNYLKSILNSNLRKANDPRKPFLTAKGNRPSFLNRIDNLREKYRNPAGHAGAVDKESAKNCCYQIMGSFEAETRLDDTESLLVELLSMLK